MQLLSVSGSPFDVGRQYGEVYRDPICKGVVRLEAPQGWPAYRYDAVIARHLMYALDHAPELVEELNGIARGAGVGFEAFLRHASDAAFGYARGPDGCTNFAAVTVDAGPVLCKTEDNSGGASGLRAKEYTVLNVSPASGYRYLAAMINPRYWHSTGINEHGLAVEQSSGPLVFGGQDGSGINYLLFTRLILARCRTADEAVDLLGSLKMCGKGYLFMLADAGGDIRAVEKWYDRQAVRVPTDRALFFANRFEAPTMQGFPARSDARHADGRFRNLSAKFAKALANGGYTLAFMRETLGLHADEGSICRHGTDSPADFHAISEPTFLSRCRDRQMGVFSGVPCRTEPEWFGFDL